MFVNNDENATGAIFGYELIELLLRQKALSQKETTLLLHYACNTGIAEVEEEGSVLEARVHYKALLKRLEESFVIRL